MKNIFLRKIYFFRFQNEQHLQNTKQLNRIILYLCESSNIIKFKEILR